ncbi:MAG: class II glutamine amidotransferase, partial [Chloroflexi bacterium]|nr:class II glutamine amidotransferase [Chloroflexota bacterium]
MIRKVCASPVHGTVGIGHTRWATHGEPSERNAHPHISASGEVVVVHNGIVENFMPLKEELQAVGVTFTSDTDTEVIVHLVDRYLQAGYPFTEAARRAIAHLRGAHGIVLLSLREPGTIVAARVGYAGGVVVGQGQGEMFVASDMPALLEHTRHMAFLDPGQMVVVTRDGFRASTLEGQALDLPLQMVSW